MTINKRNAIRAAATGAVLFGVAVAGVLAGAASATGSNAPEAAPSVAAGAPAELKQRTPVYAENARGETYGSAMLAFQPADEPDLILAQATNGKVGYVRAAELDAASGADIDRPKDALTWNSRLDAAASTGRLAAVPVYLVDGRTVIGVFEITNPEAPANTAESR